MDDTRDIAIKGYASATSAHKRLDAINGQIGRLGASHEGMRADFNNALYDPESGLLVKITDLTATVRTTLKVAGAIAAAAVTVCAGVTIYVLTHAHARAPVAHTPPPALAAQK